jgi:hypothetical protein
MPDVSAALYLAMSLVINATRNHLEEDTENSKEKLTEALSNYDQIVTYIGDNL